MTNEELLELWGQVRPFAYKQATRWAAALGEHSGVTVEDLLQSAFLALLEAAEGYDPSAGAFLTWYGLKLKAAFTEATGQRTKRQREDPMCTALSLDAPLTDDTGDLFTLADTLADPAAELAVVAVAELDFQQRRHKALELALAVLPEVQRAAVVERCCYGRKVDTRAYNAGLRALRHPSISRPLREYW